VALSTIGLAPEDRVCLRKPHPCGGREWRVTRVGADIGLECITCGRRTMLPRLEVERRAVSIAAARSQEEPA
jgi:hypothetical protein